MLINNHTAVWGSYWRDGAWGYACCHQFVKNSYCIGDAGSKAADEQTAQVSVDKKQQPSSCTLHAVPQLLFGVPRCCRVQTQRGTLCSRVLEFATQ